MEFHLLALKVCLFNEEDILKLLSIEGLILNFIKHSKIPLKFSSSVKTLSGSELVCY